MLRIIFFPIFHLYEVTNKSESDVPFEKICGLNRTAKKKLMSIYKGSKAKNIF
jgi:hypothetical protein